MWKEDLPCEKSKKSQGKRKTSKKWLWTSEVVEILLKYIKEFKAKCEFSGVDFEAHLTTMYAEICQCTAVDFVFLSAKFNNCNSPRYKTLHVKGPLIAPISM